MSTTGSVIVSTTGSMTESKGRQDGKKQVVSHKVVPDSDLKRSTHRYATNATGGRFIILNSPGVVSPATATHGYNAVFCHNLTNYKYA